MKILYIAALVSFAALACAALAIMRHVRKGADAAKSEASLADMHQAIESRLSSVVHHADEPEEQTQQVAEQNFAYFNKDSADEIYPSKTTLPKDRARTATDHR
jgi:diaminopimelate decarboxylase